MKKSYLLVVAYLLLNVGSANASLIGDQITGCLSTSLADCSNNNLFNPSSAAVVDPGVEFMQGSNAIFSADYFGDTFILSFTSGTNGAGLSQYVWEFDDLDWVDFPSGEIQDIQLISGNTLSVDSITFGVDSISIITGEITVPGGFLTVDAEFQIIATHVPIPATVWLFGSGLLGLIGMARRKKAA